MKTTIYLPCLKGVMGDWFYYSCVMKLKDVANRISYADEIHKSVNLSKLVQRSLDKGRGKKIKNYLLTNNERFFSSMIVAVYDGDPEWYNMGNISTKLEAVNIDEIPENVIDSIGILKFSGDEKFFAIDGQHRLSGIKQALAENPDLGKEEISVIFVAHSNNAKGLRRSRRLFTTLNKTARPVAKREIIALDEDDTMAIVTRHLIDDNKYFKNDRISYDKGSNIPITNTTSLTTIENLYDLLEVLYKHVLYKHKTSELKYNRLDDNRLDEHYKSACNFFDVFFNKIKPLHEYSGSNYSDTVKKYRTINGGSVYFRPLGLSIIIHVIAKLNKKHGWRKSIALISKLPHSLNESPYKSIIWHPLKNNIMPKGKTLAVRLLMYMLDENPNPTKLLEDYRKYLGEGYEGIELPSKISNGKKTSATKKT